MKILAYLKSERGMSLVQVILAAGLMSLVSLGIVQMIIESRINTRRLALLRNLAEQKTRIETLFRDQAAFGQMTYYNTGGMWASIKANTAVAETSTSRTNPVAFQIYDAGAVSDSYKFAIGPSQTTGTNLPGLTERLVPCNGFSPVAATGNDNCPISYRVMYAVDCPESGVTSCEEPNIKMVARLVFNPAPNGTLARWKTFIDQVPGFSLDTQDRDGKFDAVVIRTPSAISKSFVLRAYIPAGRNGQTSCPSATTTVCGGCDTGVGICNFAGPDPGGIHPRIVSMTVVSNPFGLLDETSNWTVSGTWRFGKTGNYTCTAKGTAYQTLTTIFQFRETSGGSLGSSTLYATAGSEVAATVVSNFYVNDTTKNYTLYAWCPQLTAPTQTVCNLGWAKGNPTVKTSVLEIKCDRNDDAF